ncbi:hypothetical protein [Streptomyces griseoloalbus]|uniref:Gliding motility protein n=1 Tax=Streptomyces griseoloalbus TaxID=67303 RepID=A0A7W8BW98_9ACTN|nr:hypothetical protein [Streptomyces albaduncus]MBB5129343.1 hypothetical protein [Streptomyces albaduncus]GGV85777.1 hypothetical protein GCM10010294_65560 [Streptomyces griseoloalbus]GGW67340.1 hypothetical protein GCM10010340_52010 [Streptomyces albaduncus]
MGVFARIFRRSKATEETRTAEAGTDGATAEPGAQDAAGAAEPKGSAEAPEGVDPAVKEADGEVTGTESVEIPKQQSSEAADNDAGEGART